MKKTSAEFKLQNASIGGTSRMSSLVTTVAEIISKVGEPNAQGCGYKVDREWVFVGPGRCVVTLYAYKALDLDINERFEFSVGGNSRGDAAAFVEWFRSLPNKDSVATDSSEMLDALLAVADFASETYKDVWRNGDHDTEHYCPMCRETTGHTEECPMPLVLNAIKKARGAK
mgnify:FL=1